MAEIKAQKNVVDAVLDGDFAGAVCADDAKNFTRLYLQAPAALPRLEAGGRVQDFVDRLAALSLRVKKNETVSINDPRGSIACAAPVVLMHIGVYSADHHGVLALRGLSRIAQDGKNASVKTRALHAAAFVVDHVPALATQANYDIFKSDATQTPRALSYAFGVEAVRMLAEGQKALRAAFVHGAQYSAAVQQCDDMAARRAVSARRIGVRT